MQAAEVLDLISLSLIRFSFILKICLMPSSGGVCGRAVNSSKHVEHRGSSRASRVVFLDKELHYPFFLCSSRCINEYRRHTAGGNPEMDQHPVQRGEAILLNMLHAEETGISSGRLDLCQIIQSNIYFTARACLIKPYVTFSGRCMIKLTKGYLIRIQCQISQRYIY